jgi:hypothetical protein
MPRHGPQAAALVSTGGMVETLRLAAVEPILGGEQVEFVTGAVVEAHSSLPVTPAELRASAWKMGFQRYYDAGLRVWDRDHAHRSARRNRRGQSVLGRGDLGVRLDPYAESPWE